MTLPLPSSCRSPPSSNPRLGTFSVRVYITLRITLNVDDTPLPSRSHTHPSHSETSRLLTSSLSLGVPVPRTTQCMWNVYVEHSDLVFSLLSHWHSFMSFIYFPLCRFIKNKRMFPPSHRPCDWCPLPRRGVHGFGTELLDRCFTRNPTHVNWRVWVPDLQSFNNLFTSHNKQQ